MKYKILIIEDEQEIREELEILLKNAGYEVEKITKFEEVANQAIEMKAHLILLDVNLPEKNGYEICTKIRAKIETPIIFVTSKNSAIDELNGLTVGGDDYIEKPYNIPVLLTRISKILKRAYPEQKEQTEIEYKGIKLEILSGLVKYQDKEIELTRNEFKILYYLFQNAGKIVQRLDIVEYMWDNQMYIDDNTLSVNMTRIREKLAEIGIENLIETKRGQGYKI